MHATCPTYLILPDVIIPVIFSKEYKSEAPWGGIINAFILCFITIRTIKRMARIFGNNNQQLNREAVLFK
jgi:hypothetical protein